MDASPAGRIRDYLAAAIVFLATAAFSLYNLRPRDLRAMPTINTLLPLNLIATIHRTFLSQ